MPTQSKYSNTLVNFENLRIPISHDLDMSGYSLTNSVYYGDGSNLTGVKDTFVTGLSFSNNILTLSQNEGQGPISVGIQSDTVTGLSYSTSLDTLYLYQFSGNTQSVLIPRFVGPTGPTGPAGIGAFGITIDGSGNPISSGLKQYLISPYNCNIYGWDVIGDTSGSIVIDVWKSTSVPTVSDTITGTEKPTLSSQQVNSDNNLTTWTTAVNIGDILAFNVDSVSNLTKVTLMLKNTKF
jgi:hypothetical protein